MAAHPTSAFLSIAAIAERSGVSAERLRVWEDRYGWPKPQRAAGGQRLYDPTLIPDLREAARRSECGRSLREDIVDGVPVWLARQPARRHAWDLTRCAAVPAPASRGAQHLRAQVEQALAHRDDATIRAAVASLPMLRPEDRDAAVLDVLRAVGHPLGNAPRASPAPRQPSTAVPQQDAPSQPEPRRVITRRPQPIHRRSTRRRAPHHRGFALGPGRPTARRALAAVIAFLQEHQALCGDPVAQAVHAAPERTRRCVAAVMDAWKASRRV